MLTFLLAGTEKDFNAPPLILNSFTDNSIAPAIPSEVVNVEIDPEANKDFFSLSGLPGGPLGF